MKSFIANSAEQTQKLGKMLVKEIIASQKRPSLFGPFRPREARPLIIALQGELGSGKTTFAQGFLKGLGVKGPYTSPTFIVLKHYKRHVTLDQKHLTKKDTSNVKCQMSNVYHVDAYRITVKDILNLGWEEIISDKNNIVITEWADRIKKIIPKNSLWIDFEWIDNNTRKIILKS